MITGSNWSSEKSRSSSGQPWWPICGQWSPKFELMNGVNDLDAAHCSLKIKRENIAVWQFLTVCIHGMGTINNQPWNPYPSPLTTVSMPLIPPRRQKTDSYSRPDLDNQIHRHVVYLHQWLKKCFGWGHKKCTWAMNGITQAEWGLFRSVSVPEIQRIHIGQSDGMLTSPLSI